MQLVPVTPGEGAEVKGVQKLEQLTNVFGRMVDAIPSTPLSPTKISAAKKEEMEEAAYTPSFLTLHQLRVAMC